MADESKILSVKLQAESAAFESAMKRAADKVKEVGNESHTAAGKVKELADAKAAADKASQKLGMRLQNMSYQLTDFSVQVQGGVSAFKALGQQMPQMLVGMGAFGAIIGLLTSLLPTLVSALFDTKSAAEAADDAIKHLTSTMGQIGKIATSSIADLKGWSKSSADAYAALATEYKKSSKEVQAIVREEAGARRRELEAQYDKEVEYGKKFTGQAKINSENRLNILRDELKRARAFQEGNIEGAAAGGIDRSLEKQNEKTYKATAVKLAKVESMEMAAAYALRKKLDPSLQFYEDLGKYKKYLAEKLISQQEFDKAVFELEQKQFASYAIKTKEKVKEVNDEFSQFKTLAVNSAEKLGSSLVDAAQGGKVAWADMLGDMAKQITKLIISSQFTKLTNMILGVKGQNTGGSFSDLLGGIFGGRSSNDAISYQARDNKGYTGTDQSDATGDPAGMTMEAAVGTVIENPSGGGAYGSSGAGKVNITVNNNAPVEVQASSAANAQGGTDITLTIVQTVNGAISDGSLDQSMTAAYGVKRQGR